MTTTTTMARPRGSRRVSLAWVVPAILALAALVLIVNVSRSMPAQETITIENRTGAPVTLNVSDEQGGSWLGLGTVDPESRATMQSVAHQGDVWRFRLTVGPDHIGEIRRTEEQLRAADWKLTIPAEAADQLPRSRRS
jgi:hypothetical protein